MSNWKLKRKEKEQGRKIFEDINGVKIPKLDANYKVTNPRSSMKLEQDRPEPVTKYIIIKLLNIEREDSLKLPE